MPLPQNLTDAPCQDEVIQMCYKIEEKTPGQEIGGENKR
jgi:hypothetical protein